MDLSLFLLGIIGIVDATSVGESIVHSQFLLQVSDLLLVAFNQESGVHHQVDSCLVSDLHHAGGKLECGGCFFQVLLLRPDVCDHNCLTVAS